MTASYLRLLADDRCEWIDHAKRAVRRAADEEFSPGDGREWAVLVPSEDILITEVEIPLRQRQKILQATPFALEEQLIRDVDSYHFALGKSVHHRHQVAVVEREAMRVWIERLERMGVVATVMVPDALAIPFDGEATVVGDGDRALLRAGPSTVYAGRVAEINDMLTLMDTQRLRIIGDIQGEPLPGLEIERLRPGEPAAPILDAAIRAGIELDLLQGDFSPQSESGPRSAALLRWTVVAAITAATVGTADLVIRHQRATNEVVALQSANADQLRKAFPQITRIVDPRIQMQQQLDQLRREAGQNAQAGFLAKLREAAPIIAEAEKVEIMAVSYRRGSLVCDFRAPELGHLENLRQALDDGGLDVELEGANTLEGRADMRVRIGQ